MMALLFLLLTAAMIAVYMDRTRLGHGLFAAAMVAGLLWFFHHATDTLDILL